MSTRSIPLQPILRFPQVARVGCTYLLTVDVRHSLLPDQWPYDREEYSLTCLLESLPWFEHRPLGEPTLIVHRFGGTYGEVRFQLTAGEQAGEGRLRMLFVNEAGLPVHAAELPGIRLENGKGEDRSSLSSNGWPHPLAAVDYFRDAIARGDRVAFRQLELLLAGIVSGRFEIRPLKLAAQESPLSLESLTAEYRQRGYDSLSELVVTDPRRDGAAVGFSSPHTLFCPVPYMGDRDDFRFWQEVWTELSGIDDGSTWTEAVAASPWGTIDLVIRQIRSWIDQQKRSRPGGSPPWTQIFGWYPGGARAVPFGLGAQVKVYWGRANDPTRPLVELSLPTREIKTWTPPPGTPEFLEEDLLTQVPSLETLEANGSLIFWRIHFEIPGREGRVRGWWDDHLNLLQREGQIHVWSKTENNSLVIGVMRDGVLHATYFRDSHILDRETVTVTICTPFVQDPVFGGAGQSVRYPDIPIKGDYLDVVRMPDGRRLTTVLKEGGDASSTSWRPAVGRDGRGRHTMRWSVPFDGRNAPLVVEIRLEEEPSERAHWMVWPRFRTRSGGGWKAYYIYEHCTMAALFCDVLWLESMGGSAQGRLRRRIREGNHFGPYPVSFRTSPENPSHDGGLPLALAVRNTATGEEGGVYLVPLQVLSDSPVELSVAVDFGTSYSVAAYRIADDPARNIDFFPELEALDACLSLHVSEDRAHVEASERDLGLLASGLWLPTYRHRRGSRLNGFLPSELLMLRPLEQAQADITDWQPAQDYTISSPEPDLSDLADHVLTDFKWDTYSPHFRGRERELREHYLGLFMELILAEIIGRSLRVFPSLPVQLTFTYPLRSTSIQVAAFQQTLNRLVRRGKESLGIPLELKDGIGIYDEARAARVAPNIFGEVCLVANLGSSTLNLFIAANNQGGTALDEVVDSARLGGNLLLREIASQPQGLLPEGGNWRIGEPWETARRLQAWMLGPGSPALFGVQSAGRPTMEQMDLAGFDQAAGARQARVLLDRYFRLIVEYMARNLAAYLFGQWFPKVDSKYHSYLRLSVQLTGNGWRLRYQDENHVQATQSIRDEVRHRVKELWNEIPGNPYTLPDDSLWEDASRYAVADPKAEPIRNAVGRAMPFDEVYGNRFSYTLVDLEVLRGNGERILINWFSRVPFPTGASTHVQLKGIQPPLVLSSPAAHNRVEVRSLEAALEGRVNHALQTESVIDMSSGNYFAPVASLVWEAVFESGNFWPEKGGR